MPAAAPPVRQAPGGVRTGPLAQRLGFAAQNGDQGVASPARSVDTKQLTDIVKGDVKGGESAVPSPFEILWQPANAELIKDEPLAVAVPSGLQPLTPKVYVPGGNLLTKGKYELGRQLYFDPRVSLDGTVSCATCHNPAKGWTDGMAVSIGIAGQTGGRSIRPCSIPPTAS